jgi:C-terminal processing protease CtpA/Prc
LGRVTGFPPGFDAATSSLQQDDFIVSVDGQTLDGQPAGTIFRFLNDKLDRNVRLRIRRGGEERELDMTSGSSSSRTIGSLRSSRRRRNS